MPFLENLVRKLQPLSQTSVCLATSSGPEYSYSPKAQESASPDKFTFSVILSICFAYLPSTIDTELIVCHVLSRNSFNNLDTFVSINHIECGISICSITGL